MSPQSGAIAGTVIEAWLVARQSQRGEGAGVEWFDYGLVPVAPGVRPEAAGVCQSNPPVNRERGILAGAVRQDGVQTKFTQVCATGFGQQSDVSWQTSPAWLQRQLSLETLQVPLQHSPLLLQKALSREQLGGVLHTPPESTFPAGQRHSPL